MKDAQKESFIILDQKREDGKEIAELLTKLKPDQKQRLYDLAAVFNLENEREKVKAG